MGFLAKKLHLFSSNNEAPKLSLPGKLVFPRYVHNSVTVDVYSSSFSILKYIIITAGNPSSMFDKETNIYVFLMKE